MPLRNRTAVVLTAVSIAFLIPGLVEPLITISASFTVFGVTNELFRETRSILGAVESLWDSGNGFVAGLILFFSVIVPFVKGATLPVILLMKEPARKHRLYLFVRSISKWSMADVFAVGVFITLLAARADDNLDAVAGAGFYWFAAYCLVSNLAFQVLQIPDPAGASSGAEGRGSRVEGTEDP